jgi:RNA polymerase sigma factor (sigma-70 family)
VRHSCRMAVLEVEVAESSLANDAVQFLFRAHQRRVYSYCYRRLGSREEAEDAVQATFLNAWQSLRRGVRPEAPLPWLYGIAHNVCLTRNRSMRRRGRIELAEASAPEPASPESRRDELHGVDDALRALPHDQRRAFLLREWRGFSYAEIASAMSLSNSAVESLIFRARRGLAASLEGGVQQARAGGFCILGLGSFGSLFSGFKTTMLGVLGTTGAKVAASVAVVTTATTVAAAPSHPRLQGFLMAPIDAAKAGVAEILQPEEKAGGQQTDVAAPSVIAAPSVAIVSEGSVLGVRPLVAAAPLFPAGVDAPLPPEAVPLSTEEVLPDVIVEPVPPVEEEPPVDAPPVDEPPVEAPPPGELPPEQAPPPEEVPPPVDQAPPPEETSVPPPADPPAAPDGTSAEPAPDEAARTDTTADPPPEPALEPAPEPEPA